MSFDHPSQKLVVRRNDLEHNHRIGQDIFPHYPSTRRLDNSEVQEVKEIVKLAPKMKLVKRHIMKKIGKQVTLKDIQNIRTKVKTVEKNGRNDAQVLVDRLEEKLRSDEGAKGGIIVNQDD